MLSFVTGPIAMTSGANLITAWMSVAMVAIYIVVAFYAWRAVREAQAARKQQTIDAASARTTQIELSKAESRPYVVAYFDFLDSPLIHLNLHNVGRTLASNIRVTSNPPLLSTLDKGDGHFGGFVTTPKELLAPSQCIRGLFDNGPDRFNGREMPTRFELILDYEGPAVEQVFHGEIQVLDLDQFADLTTVKRRSTHDIALEIEKVRNIMNRWNKVGFLGVSLRQDSEPPSGQ